MRVKSNIFSILTLSDGQTNKRKNFKRKNKLEKKKKT